MNSFLGTNAFAGPSDERPLPSSSFVGQAQFNGCISFSNWPRADVATLLPPEIALAANLSPTPDLHPVAFIFGEQTAGATMFGGLTFPLGLAYYELAMAIPFVKPGRGADLHVYIPRMYCGYFPATWSGNVHYGFSKEMATMRWQGPIFLAMGNDDALLLHAAVESTEPWSPGSAFRRANFEAMQAIFRLPVLGRKRDGSLISSRFGWDFGEAQVRAADTCVSIDAPFLAGLTPRRCHDVSSGSFDVRGMVWRLSWPAACRLP